MFKFYLKSAYRNLSRNKEYTAVIMFGFIIGLYILQVMMLYITNEWSYDQFNQKRDRIYRLEKKSYPMIPAGIVTIFKGKIPGIENTLRIQTLQSLLIETSDKNSRVPKLLLDRVLLAEPSIFSFFSYKAIYGDLHTAFNNEYSIVITHSVSRRIFGNSDPIGKKVRFKGINSDFTITAVISDVKQSHLEFQAIFPFTFVKKFLGQEYDLDIGDHRTLVYLLLQKNANPERIRQLIIQNTPRITGDEIETFRLNPLKYVYFNTIPSVLYSGKTGNLKFLRIFSLSTLFILIMVCINFINFNLARVRLRAREAGLKKIIGESPFGLILQFLIEAQIIILIAEIISLLLIELTLPLLNSFFDMELSIQSTLTISMLPFFFLIVFLFGICSWIFPALYYAAFKPLSVYKTQYSPHSLTYFIRKVLVIFQFTIAGILIITSILGILQLNFVKNQPLGFNYKNVITMIVNAETYPKTPQFIKELACVPHVEKVSASAYYPGEDWFGFYYKQNNRNYLVRINGIDPQYFDLMQMKLISGRNFSYTNPEDISDFNSFQSFKLIMNETCARLFNVRRFYQKLKGDHTFNNSVVIGIVQDFHFQSLHYPVMPVAFIWDPTFYRKINVRIAPVDIHRTIRNIHNIWIKYSPDFPFEFIFLENYFNQQYQKDDLLIKLLFSLAITGFFIAGMGIYGVTSFIILQRTKEIGIRKVNGASVPNIIILFLSQFVKWVLVANLIAFPVSYIIMEKWFSAFTLHISFSILPYIYALFIALIVVIVTVGYQVLKVARSNPVQSLRHE